MSPDYEAGYRAGIEAAANVVRASTADNEPFAESCRATILALLPKTEPTCATCGGKGIITTRGNTQTTATGEESGLFGGKAPCPDCRPETPPAIGCPHARPSRQMCPHCMGINTVTPPNPEAAPVCATCGGDGEGRTETDKRCPTCGGSGRAP